MPRKYPRVKTPVGGKSRAKQSFKAQCDINTIMKKYEKTGLIDHVKTGGTYGDFTQVTDYHTALNQIQAAEEAFMTLPASLRGRFENDPAQLISFLEDPKNKKEAISLGLVEAPAEQPLQAKTEVMEDPLKAPEGDSKKSPA